MTLRNSSRRSVPTHQTSWRKDIVSYRRARVQRSLARLRAHPAVNPTGPHGPHGCFTSTLPSASSSLTPTGPRSSTLAPSHPTEAHPSHHKPNGIIPALFDDLVRRQLGIDPSDNDSTHSARIAQYFSAARAVTSPPSLSDPRFITRLATGIDPCRLKDKTLLSSIASHPINSPPQSQRVRDIHIAIQKARERHVLTKLTSEKQSRPSQDSPCPRRSPRKRLRSQKENNPSLDHQEAQKRKSSLRGRELEAFRPSPESVMKTRSEAARARRSLARQTPSECCFCPDPQNFEGEEISSELIGPFVDRRGNAKLFVHFDCACWAPQVYTDPSSGQLRRVYDEYCRGRKLKCSLCGEKGATIGCYIQKCKKVFHYRCLEAAKAYCVERFFAAFCQTHAHLGKKPSYKILMEAATIADVSAAQRREDTTYGLDAPHSRYTLLRRRETEIIFSRKWRIASHTGPFDSGKVVFSHRRKAILGKTDRICVGDCVRVVKTSALDIASGRLAFMAFAQKGEVRDSVSAVEARAAIASRESTGLFLLRNLRNSREWKAGDIEIIRSIPMESKQLQVTPENHPGGLVADHRISEGLVGSAEGKDPKKLSGKKRSAPTESEHLNRGPDRKKHKVPADDNNTDAVRAITSEKVNSSLPSIKLPSFSRGASRHNKPKEADVRSASNSQNENRNDTAKASGLSFSLQGGALKPLDDREKVTKSEHQADGSIPNVRDGLPQTSFQKAEYQQEDASTSPKFAVNSQVQLLKGPRTVTKVKSAWEAFLEEQLPRERLLRPDDSNADALRNMARLWGLLTPTERDAYEGRGKVCGLSISNGRSETLVTASQQAQTAVQANLPAGFFSNATRQITSGLSRSKLRVNINATEGKGRSSTPLPAGRDGGGEGRNSCVDTDQPNWDDLFPSNLPNDRCWTGGHRLHHHENTETPSNRVKAPPTRPKTRI